MSAAAKTVDLKRREAYRHWVQEHVRWSDTDLVGHANNLVFGAFAETGRCHFLRTYVEHQAPQRVMILPAQLVLNFHAELHWPASVEVGTGVISLGNTSFRVGQGMFDGGRCFGSAETVLVAIDETSRRPRQIPARLREWLQGYLIST